ncbi:MAG: GNAT family N-acetyltransferase [Lachnospiraceae bacterium]|nr:GNAT family N-acetyltransferase [Lachnospiraceae bacterium]
MIKTNKLSAGQINDITKLFNECKAYESLNATLTLPEEDYESDDELFLLCYENDTLISFLSAFVADDSFVEVYGLTKPEYRKKGLFTKLLYGIADEKDFIGGRDMLYLYDGKSNDCQLAYNHLGFNLSYSEYMMSAKSSFDERPQDSVIFEETEDYELLKKLYVDIFDGTKEYADMLIDEAASDVDTTFFIFKRDDEIIGMVFLSKFSDNSMYLWNFGLIPKLRGKRISHAMLSEVFKYAKECGVEVINLQVSSANLPAFRLYKKRDFEIKSMISYFTNPYIDLLY